MWALFLKHKKSISIAVLVSILYRVKDPGDLDLNPCFFFFTLKTSLRSVNISYLPSQADTLIEAKSVNATAIRSGPIIIHREEFQKIDYSQSLKGLLPNFTRGPRNHLKLRITV